MFTAFLIVYSALTTLSIIVLIKNLREANGQLKALPSQVTIDLARALQDGEVGTAELVEAGFQVNQAAIEKSTKETQEALEWCARVEQFCRWVIEDVDRALSMSKWRPRAFEIVSNAPSLAHDAKAFVAFKVEVQRNFDFSLNAQLVWTSSTGRRETYTLHADLLAHARSIKKKLEG